MPASPPVAPPAAAAAPRRGRVLVAFAVAVCLGAGLLTGAPSAGARTVDEPVTPTSAPDASSPLPGLPGEAEEEQTDPRSQDFPSMPRRCATRAQQIPKTAMKCTLRKAGPHRPTLVLWGDSHLWMMLPAVRAALKGRKVNLVGFLFGGCVPARPDMEVWAGQPCSETAALANRYLDRMQRRGKKVRVILGSYWGAHLHRVYYYPTPELEQSSRRRRDYVLTYTRPLFRWLGRRGIPTDVLFQGPAAVPPDPDCEPGPTPYGCDIPRYRAYYRESYLRGFLDRQMRHLAPGARLIDYSDAVCAGRTCPARQRGGVQTWYDAFHLSTATTSRLARFFVPSVNRLQRR